MLLILRRSFFTKAVSHISDTRKLVTLAIESSCDDTAVAILELNETFTSGKYIAEASPTLKIHHHAKITANNLSYGGIHPIASLDSHRQNLSLLVQDALEKLPTRTCKPDFISVTRGPGMRSSLSVGLEFAKGLAVAWKIPLVAVNHMQAHALTPRLLSAMHSIPLQPTFPFLSLLVSGGHTMLIHSKSLTDHPTFAETGDIAIGEAIDKIARTLLPLEVLATSESTMYGPVLETFAFPASAADYAYHPPLTRAEELLKRVIPPYSWGFNPPLSKTKGGLKDLALEYTFSGICTTTERIVTDQMGFDERRDLAKEAMRVAFEHIASRIVLSLQKLKSLDSLAVDALSKLVVSGGVAANSFLRHVYVSAQISNNSHILIRDDHPTGYVDISMFEATVILSSCSHQYHCVPTMRS